MSNRPQQLLALHLRGRQHHAAVQEGVDGGQQVLTLICQVGCLVELLVGHEGGDGAADLVVVHVGAARAQQQEEEAHGHGHLQHRVQLHRLPQPHEGHGGAGEELHAAHEDHRGLSVLRDLL